MSSSVLILGESGTGKSCAIRTLPPEETILINVNNKPLPFRGHKAKYKQLSEDGLTGNYYKSDDSNKIIRLLKFINDKRQDVKYIVIDDFGYTFINNYMRRAKEKSFDKFVDIGSDAWRVFEEIKLLRDDLFVFVIMHTEIDAHHRYKPKTVGKLIDNSNVIEGIFGYVFHSLIIDMNHVFLTNNDSVHMAHSPMDMFAELHIPNDLKLIADTITAYNEGEE
jgi:hypothetical protein